MIENIHSLLLRAEGNSEALLAREATSLLFAIRLREASDNGNRNFIFPVYAWNRLMPSKAVEKKRRGMAIMAMQAGAAALKAGERLQIAAFLIRFAPVTADDFQQLLAPITEGDLDTVCHDTLFDLITIYASIKDWQRVHETGRLWLDRDHADTWQTPFVCDFMFQASLQSHRLNGDTGSLRRAVPTPRSMTEYLTSKLEKPSKNLFIYEGLTKCLTGEVRASVNDFVAANETPGRTIQFLRSSEHVLPWPLLEEMRTRAIEGKDGGVPWQNPAITHHFRHSPAGRGCVLVACDINYFFQFFRTFCESFAHHNPAGLIHLHCIGFQGRTAVLDELETRLGIQINYSVDVTAPGEPASDIFRGYCAATRYLFLPRYLEEYSYVGVADVDGVITRPVHTLWQAKGDAILLSTTMKIPQERSTNAIWGNISAGIFAVRNLDSHKAFVRMMSLYMARRLEAAQERQEKYFFADQTGLMLCFLTMRKDCQFDQFDKLFFKQGGAVPLAGRLQAKKLWQVTQAKEKDANLP